MPINSYQDLTEKIIKKAIPLECLFELTYKCNLKCIHCYIIRQRKKELDTKEVYSILKQLKEAGCIYLTLSGGEVFLRKDFFTIAAYIRKFNFAVSILSNGTLIDEKIVGIIETLHPISVEVSLYGLKDTHEKITRVKGSFDNTIKAIRLLIKKGIRVIVKTTLMRQNAADLPRLYRFVKGKGYAERKGRLSVEGGAFISPRANKETTPLNYRADNQQIKDYMKQIIGMRGDFNKLPKPSEPKENDIFCAAGLTKCAISAYGQLNPCVQIRLKGNNDLRQNTFIEIWKDNEEINKMRALHFKDRVDCRGCSLVSYCFFCPAIALLERGSLTAMLPEFCRQAKIKKEIYENIYK
ncbi:MAG: hypothetical protein AUJ70_02515 [Candidatus Omnitrophica bacterium CG1_02_40_15]|nr:MAG: hypothetical protein AUJ70_02515 [Candidatus Omnitrophica bacterium CG1_02_40_15]